MAHPSIGEGIIPQVEGEEWGMISLGRGREEVKRHGSGIRVEEVSSNDGGRIRRGTFGIH